MKVVYLSTGKKSKIDQVEDMKIWDSTRIYNSSRILGATDKGIANKPIIYVPLRPVKPGLGIVTVEIRVCII
jgi:hypothetical protein